MHLGCVRQISEKDGACYPKRADELGVGCFAGEMLLCGRSGGAGHPCITSLTSITQPTH